MEVIITEWALDAYIDMKARRVFSDEEYHRTLRPDALRLKHYPRTQNSRYSSFGQSLNAHPVSESPMVSR